ncbi:hypothetical protein V502_07035 [Pseudogymnoascus sp. VKM F-4520 (FW-2644)]|nr:hypothetical protein V502_07035 [Pseudogymnoascus sp. VKM F-4520 (FW-2644)]
MPTHDQHQAIGDASIGDLGVEPQTGPSILRYGCIFCTPLRVPLRTYRPEFDADAHSISAISDQVDVAKVHFLFNIRQIPNYHFSTRILIQSINYIKAAEENRLLPLHYKRGQQAAPMPHEQTGIPFVYFRGGSSRAIFFKSIDLPWPGVLRDTVLKRVNGTPDPIQIDGMGGSRVITSKVAMIPAVGLFAIDEGLVKGTQKVLIAHVSIDSVTGKSVSEGDFSIATVPGTGAPILMDYRGTVGGAQNKGILPTGNKMDEVDLESKAVQISICDVGNICVFVNAKDIGLVGTETAQAINENAVVISRCRKLRGRTAKLLGMCKE